MSLNIPHLYKPDYAGERCQHEELKKQIVALSGGNLTYKTVYGNRKDIVDIRRPRHEEIFEKINRKIKYKQIVRRYEVFFNQKLNKYTPQYLSSLSELLTKKTKAYSNQRKNLTLKNETINIKSIQEPRLFPKGMLSLRFNKNKSKDKENDFETLLQHQKEQPFLRSKQKNLTIKVIEPHDEEFIAFDPKMYYNSHRILNKLKSETRFYYSKDRQIERMLKNKLISNLEDTFENNKDRISLNKKIRWDKIKRSTSYDTPSSYETINQNIYSRRNLQNTSNFSRYFHSKQNSTNFESSGLHTYNSNINIINNNKKSKKTKLSKVHSNNLFNTIK